MNKVHKALFTLLRSGLWSRDIDDLTPFPLNDAEWEQVHTQAKNQTVCAIVFEGLDYLPEEYQPSEGLLLKWVSEVERIERQNRMMNRVLCLLYDDWGTEGLVPVLLKGQGVAMYYTNSLARECGDIDLYFRNKEDEQMALQMREDCHPQQMPDGAYSYEYEQVEIEHHPYVLDIHNPRQRKQLAAWVAEKGTKEITLPKEDDTFDVLTPAPIVNLVLLSTHLLKHVVGRGIGLRQFCDIARAYHTLSNNFDAAEYVTIYNKVHLGKWMDQLHAFLVQYIGLPKEELPAENSVQVSQELLDIVLEGGNFGQHAAELQSQNLSACQRKLQTLKAFWMHRKFSLKVAPQETCWILMQLLFGNLG